MKINFINDMTAFRHFPQIRSYIIAMWTAKIAGWLSLILFLPLMLIGFVCIALVTVFDRIGQIALWLPHKSSAWIFKFQQDQIKNAHDVVTIDEIQKRIGTNDK